ncbi:hypothetical protein ACIO6T_37810 [Streptomyces sp. NPDC087532]|uniref:hypothetical protein n=1 Tax=Streptomyces sp. NPDC087532 TaxID=3365795 RepID=UPI0037FC06DA
MTAPAASSVALSDDTTGSASTGPAEAPEHEQSSTPSSGPDLARIALRQWVAAARSAPPVATRRRPPRSSQDDSGRHPVGLGAAVGALAASHGWLHDLAGERVRDLWEELFPALQEHAVVAGFDVQQRLLVLRPLTRAAAAHIQLRERQLLAILTEAAGVQVTGLKVLLPDARAASGVEASLSAHALETLRLPAAAPVPVRRPGSEEYLRTREALRALRMPHGDDDDEGSDPFATTRNSLRAPEPQKPARPSSEAMRRWQAERTHRLALARARAERREADSA